MTDDARAAFREDMRRDPGYLDENVITITAMDKANLDALLAEVRHPDEFRVVPGTTRTLIEVGHEHGPYGWRGCTSCRHLYAENVAERFPPSRPINL